MRNPVMILILTYGLILGGYIISMLLGMVLNYSLMWLAMLGQLITLVGVVLFLYFVIMMLLDLKRVTNDESFMWWLVFIPCANYYLLWWLAPQQVSKAKQMAGLPDTSARNIVLYIFLTPFALAADLNDLAAPGSAMPPGPMGMGGLGGGFGAPPGGPPGLGMGGPPPQGPPPGPGGFGPPGGMGR